MVFMVLEGSTSDCGSGSTGSNPVEHPGNKGVLAQLARASALHAEGCGIVPRGLHKKK